MGSRLLAVITIALGLLLGGAAAAHADPDDIEITAPSGTGEDTTPLIEGRGDPAFDIVLLVNGVEVTRTSPAADGTWSHQLLDPLAKGQPADIAAEVREANGQVIASDYRQYYVLRDRATITVTSPTTGDSIGPSGQVDITVDTGEYLAARLYLDGELVPDSSTFLGDTGTFVQFAGLTREGPADLSVRAEDAFGRPVTSNTVPVVVDLTPPTRPVITSPAAGAVVSTDTVTFAGTGEPGATVELRTEGAGTPVGELTVVGPDGTWGFTTQMRDEGNQVRTPRTHPGQRYPILIRSTDPVGNTTVGDGVTFSFAGAAISPSTSVPPPTSPPSSGTVEPAPTGARAGELAATGSGQAWTLGTTGAGMVVAGVLLLLLGRRTVRAGTLRRH